MKKTVFLYTESETDSCIALLKLFKNWIQDFTVSTSYSAITDKPELLIISENFSFPLNQTLHVPVVVSSDNTTGLHQLISCKTPVFTCGFHEKDCLSYSSFLSETKMISLNRTITSFSGVKIEPFELAVNKKACIADPFSLLAFIMTMLINDFSVENLSDFLGKNYIS